MRKQQVKCHGKIDFDLAYKWLRRRIQKFIDKLRILMNTRNNHGKPDIILSSSSCSAYHLMKFGGCKVGKLSSVVAVTL